MRLSEGLKFRLQVYTILLVVCLLVTGAFAAFLWALLWAVGG